MSGTGTENKIVAEADSEKINETITEVVQNNQNLSKDNLNSQPVTVPANNDANPVDNSADASNIVNATLKFYKDETTNEVKPALITINEMPAVTFLSGEEYKQIEVNLLKNSGDAPKKESRMSKLKKYNPLNLFKTKTPSDTNQQNTADGSQNKDTADGSQNKDTADGSQIKDTAALKKKGFGFGFGFSKKDKPSPTSAGGNGIKTKKKRYNKNTTKKHVRKNLYKHNSSKKIRKNINTNN